MLRPRKPTVFIGSSKESLPVLKVIADAIGAKADVVPWTDSERFREPGHFFLDSLIAAAAEFDFAILIFGSDDIVSSRFSRKPAPRDNVVFELGLFLSQLDRERAIVVSPRVWRTKLKILTDLQNLNLAEYDPPARKADTAKSLSEVCSTIRRRIDRLGARTRDGGPTSVSALGPALDEMLASALSGSRRVRLRNIALDLEVTWRLLHDQILARDEVRNVQCELLFMDWKSQAIRGVSSRTASSARAHEREKEIVRFLRDQQVGLERRRVQLLCKTYPSVPQMHGFLVDQRILFLSLCGIRSGRLVGAPNPYLRLEKPLYQGRSRVVSHMFAAFEGWFNELWRRGRTVSAATKL